MPGPPACHASPAKPRAARGALATDNPPCIPRSHEPPGPAHASLRRADAPQLPSLSVFAHSFLRLHCDDCGHDRLVVVDLDAKLAFSYVMNRMGATTMGDPRGFGAAMGLFAAL